MIEDNSTDGPGTRPLPDTDAPRRPAQKPTPAPQPQAPASEPGVTSDAATQDIAEEDRGGFVQRSGGGADNRVTEDDSETDAGQPTE